MTTISAPLSYKQRHNFNFPTLPWLSSLTLLHHNNRGCNILEKLNWDPPNIAEWKGQLEREMPERLVGDFRCWGSSICLMVFHSNSDLYWPSNQISDALHITVVYKNVVPLNALFLFLFRCRWNFAIVTVPSKIHKHEIKITQTFKLFLLIVFSPFWMFLSTRS